MPVDIRKASIPAGAISLEKGTRAVLTKTPVVKLIMRWATGTDYDAGAEVLYRQGGRLFRASVTQFGTKGNEHSYTSSILNGAVRHLGDVGRGADRHAADKEEIIEIRLTPDIIAVVPWCYSAQSNGTGSFYRYQVSMIVDNGAGDIVAISAENANNDDTIYTCVPAIIRQNDEGVVVDAVELYSERKSERRPLINEDGTVAMNGGPINAYK